MTPNFQKQRLIEMLFASYLTFAAIWTTYMAYETYNYVRPQSRPYFVGFLISNLVLTPFSFVLSLTGGILGERLESAYGDADRQKQKTIASGRKTLIG
jgi:hypothetical protein